MTRKNDPWLDAYEVGKFICGVTEDDGDGEITESAIFNRYGVTWDIFEKLIADLLPLCDVAQSPLTGNIFRGFADRSKGFWLAKLKDESDE